MTPPRISRRGAMLGGAGVIAAVGLGVGGCGLTDHTPSVTMGGADFRRGHRLRGERFPDPTVEERAKIVICGGGIAGLSAGWALAEAGVEDFQLLELEDGVGGNARSGRNAVSAYPLGAHYLRCRIKRRAG